MMENEPLMMRNRLKIRLEGIEFPDERTAMVTFRLFSDGHTIGDPYRDLAAITREIGREPGHLDYDRIVGNAAKMIANDFREISENLSKYEKT